MTHKVTYHPNHPNDTQKMIHMFMGYKDVLHIHPIKTSAFELMKNGISATTVHHKVLVIFLYYKAGIEALCN